MSIRYILVGLLILAASAFSNSAHAQSGIANKLSDSLDAMVNITDPSISHTNRRTIITGGSISLKMPSQSIAEGFAFRPPSLQVGCGGIDAFFGSFSMVSKEQLVQALRGIVTGAIVYAFRLALQALCPSCESVMTSIGDLLSEFNRLLQDTCSATMNFLESNEPSAITALRTKADQGNTTVGINADSFESKIDSVTAKLQKFRTGAGGGDPDRANEMLAAIGNLGYVLAKKGETQVFNFVPDFNNFIEEVLSITGTVIICQANEDTCPQSDPSLSLTDDPNNIIKQFKPPILSLEHLVKGTAGIATDGSSLPPGIWRCNTHGSIRDCMDMSHQELDSSFIGMEQRIRNAFLGTASSPGIIYKLRYNPTAAPTDVESDWILISGPLTGKVFNLAKKDQQSARGFVEDFADVIAADLVYSLVSESMTKYRVAAGQTQNTYFIEFLNQIEAATVRAREDYMKIAANAESRNSSYKAYLARMEVLN